MIPVGPPSQNDHVHDVKVDEFSTRNDLFGRGWRLAGGGIDYQAVV